MISGIFNCLGSDDLESTLQELGYREIQRGQLSAEKTQHLYGHESELTSVRLQLSLFTYKVENLEELHHCISTSNVISVSPIAMMNLKNYLSD